MSLLPPSLVSALQASSLAVFCGSRKNVPPSILFSTVASSVPKYCRVACGCVGGLCGLARASFPNAFVFRASMFGTGASSYARRSINLVGFATGCQSSVWLSFPSSSCPVGLLPSSNSSKCFCGLGSGSWASLALASGCGVSCFVWLPPHVSFPSNWGFSSIGGGWFTNTI